MCVCMCMCVRVCVCVHLRVIFCMWHVHVFCVLYRVFVCICMLDWRRDLLPSWSRLGWKFPGVPASLFVHKPSIERPHKHVKVAKHLDNIDKNIIIRNIFYINAIFSNVKTLITSQYFFIFQTQKAETDFPNICCHSKHALWWTNNETSIKGAAPVYSMLYTFSFIGTYKCW